MAAANQKEDVLMASFTQSCVRGGSMVAALLALAGCVAPQPTGPQVYAMPGAGKSYEQFMGEDGYCRQAAATMVGPAPSAQDTTNAAVGSAVLGTALGAAAGAAIGSVGGAAGMRSALKSISSPLDGFNTLKVCRFGGALATPIPRNGVISSNWRECSPVIAASREPSH